MPVPVITTVPLDAVDVNLYWLREGVNLATTYGVVPGSGTPRTLNVLSENLAGERATIRAALQRPSGLPGPMRSVGKAGANSNLAVHLALDEDLYGLLEMWLCEEWVAATITETTIAAGSEQFTDSGNGFIAAGFLAGQTVKASGFTDSGGDINGRWRIDTLAAGTLDVSRISGVAQGTEAASQSVTIESEVLTNGAKLISACAERFYNGFAADGYQMFTGVAVNSATLGFDEQQLFTFAAQCNHRGPETRSNSTDMPAAAAAAANITTILADATNNLVNFALDGTAFAAVKSFNVTLANNMTPVTVAGQAQPQWQSLGTRALSSQFRGLILAGDTLLDAMDLFSPQRASFEIVPDAGTDDLVFELHRMKPMRFSDYNNPGGTGENLHDMTLEGEEDLVYTDRWITVSKVPK